MLNIPASSVLEVQTRFSDLDTQRHVTSRTYEDFAATARFHFLEEAGMPWRQVIECGLKLNPIAGSCRFFREQGENSILLIESRIIQESSNIQLWLQHILEPSSKKVVCEIITRTISTQNGSPINLADFLPKAAKSSYHISDPSLKGLLADIDIETKLKDPTPNRGHHKVITAPFTMLYSDRSPFFDYSPSALWRLFEEGRWHFGNALELTEEKIKEIDTITFFTAATFRYYEIPPAGTPLEIRIWIDRIEKIRCFFRQDVVNPVTGKVLMSILDEQLIVSLEKRRPRRAPPEFTEIVKDYIQSP